MQSFLQGLKDSWNLRPVLLNILQKEGIQTLFMKCVLFNGVFFLGSQIFLHYCLVPCFDFILDSIRIKNWTPIIQIYHLFWSLPLYSIGIFINNYWYQEIATMSMPRRRRKANLSKIIGEKVYRILLYCFLGMQILILYSVPYTRFISYFGVSWIYAFMIFEYKWNLLGYSIDYQIEIFESNAIYFLGFGATMSFVTIALPTLIANGIASLIFPLAMMATTILSINPNTTKWPLFTLSEFLSLFLIRTISPKQSRNNRKI